MPEKPFVLMPEDIQRIMGKDAQRNNILAARMVSEMIKTSAESIEELYTSIIAEKFFYEKKIIVKELHKYGIKTIFTSPQNLTINLINKYLEFKAAELI